MRAHAEHAVELGGRNLGEGRYARLRAEERRGNYTLESIDLTGKTTTLNRFEMKLGEALRGLTLSPDGKSVTTTKTRVESEPWVLDGFNGGR